MVGSVNRGRLPLFCDAALAARIERAEAQLIAKTGEAARRRHRDADGFVIPTSGGVASFVEPGSPFNKVAGLGFGGVPSADTLDQLEAAFAGVVTATQVELSQLADPAIGTRLTERGYRLISFENVLGRYIRGRPEPVARAGIEVRRSGEPEFDAWFEVVAAGVADPDGSGIPAHEEFPREILERVERDLDSAGVVRYVARRDGVVAGGASLHIASGVAQLAGGATAPAHRRRGIHTALLEARLADAADAGCEIAVVTTQPGSTSQQNVQRRGFDLLYARAVLVKQPG
jgi:GNAT superfamily N-acetyltransferase